MKAEMGEVIPVDFSGTRTRIKRKWLGKLTRIKPYRGGEHEPGTLPEIGPDGVVTWAHQLGIPEPEPALTRDEMIQRASQAFVRDAVDPSDETARHIYKALVGLDDEEVDRAYNHAKVETDLL